MKKTKVQRITSAARVAKILMGVWRDPSQPRTEETGALSYCDRLLKFIIGCLRSRGY
jgi:hypothetical protein